MAPYLVSFLLGIGGSLHCVGMCGPLVLAASQGNMAHPARLKSFVLYHLGRILVYSFIGFMAGFLGYGLSFSGLQQYFSIFLGMVIILLALRPGLLRLLSKKQVLTSAYWSTIKNWLLKVPVGGKNNSRFILGMMNGFLPCGLVYMALMNSLLAGNSLEGSFYMLFFGLGTTPALLVLPGIIRIFKIKPFRFQRFLPYLLFGVGILLIVRGLEFQHPVFHEVNDFISTCMGQL